MPVRWFARSMGGREPDRPGSGGEEAGMPLIAWTKAMSVGVPLLDADHQILVNIINSLAEKAGASRTPRHADQLKGVLDMLMRYVAGHFAREEKVMAACGYPEAATHHTEHEDFIARVTAFSERIRSGDAAASGDLLAYLEGWWQHHILIVDMAYRPFAEGNAEAVVAARSFPPLIAAGA
jgi:hemerythrin-like metal-binding protein